jgi:hypothetical protein
LLPACEGDPGVAPFPTERGAENRCEGDPWGTPAYDRIYAERSEDDLVLVLSPDLAEATSAVLGRLGAAFEHAARVDPGTLSLPARVVLQNDAWGVVQKLDADGTSSDEVRLRLRTAAASLVRRLAVPPAELAPQGIPVAVNAVLRSSDGWVQVGTEHSVIGHEAMHGLRRAFRLWQRGDDDFALTSQLVTLDAAGRARLTGIAGEVERLRLGPEAPLEATVYELDRSALRCRGIGHELRQVDRVAHLPAAGANAFLRRFDPPVLLSDLPCAGCHEGPDHLMSLPDPQQDIEGRLSDLLRQAEASAPTMGLAQR